MQRANKAKRVDRVAEMIQRKLAQIIQQEIKDPRMPNLVTISAVKVAADLSHAKVYFTVFNEDKALVQTILNAAAPYLRTALSRTIQLRTVPQLHFIYDESIEYGKKLSNLIDKVNPPESESDSDD